MKRLAGRSILIGILVATGFSRADPEAPRCDRLLNCKLVWADEFEGSEVDPEKWEVQLGDGTDVGLPSGWGNNELQNYQVANATVADGYLTITARKEAGGEFTSARLRSLGRGDFLYGRIEMRALMPVGQGLWPAFWMLPSESEYGGWAASGEIDIMEYLGSQPNRLFGTLHYGGPWPENVHSSREHFVADGTLADEFHRFAIEWEPGEIRWYFDGDLYATQTEWSSVGGPFPAPFDRRFHILLNLAVGGNLPGPPDEATRFPQQLVIDWVRVWQASSL